MTAAKSISDALLAPFDHALFEQKQGMTYIAAEHVRMRVIQATGNQFTFTIDKTEILTDAINIKARKDGLIPPVMLVTATLTIPELGSRTDIGVHVLELNSGEDMFKAAASDAFKRCAMNFGVGLDQLYIKGSKQPAVLSQPATARPPVQQHARNGVPRQTQALLTDSQFCEEVRKAMETKDGSRFKALTEEAGERIARWLVLIESCETPASLDWIAGRVTRQEIDAPEVRQAIDKRRGALAKDREGAAF